MKSRILPATLIATLAVHAQWGGSQTRRAEIRGGGGDGKCTIEVEVDDIAEVEIRGDMATLRTRSGQPASWRRFQCNQVMPPRPGSFRFRGIDGRGRQELVRDPSDGGPAVIRIDDPKGGREGYTFDVEWRGGDYGGGAWDDRSRGRGRGNSARDDEWQGGWNDRGRDAWNGRAGSTFRFSGDGNGVFNRRNGRDERVSDVNVSLGPDGRVMLSFDARGNQRMNFAGRANRYSRDSIEADLRGGNAGGNLRGSATIYLDRRGEVERIEMDGRTNNDEFRLRWRAR